MERKISALHNKVVSLLMSLLMVLSTVIGYLPVSAVSVSAAGTALSLKEVKDGTLLSSIVGEAVTKDDIIITPRTPSGYKANDDFDLNKDGSHRTIASSKRLILQNKSGFSTWDNTNKKWATNKKFHPEVTYFKAGQDKTHKKYYNLTIRVVDYTLSGDVWYPFTTSEAYYSKYSDNKVKPMKPYIVVSSKKCGVSVKGIKNLKVQFTWSEYTGENESSPLKIPSDGKHHLYTYITNRDLDASQAIQIEDQTGVRGVYKLKGTKHITEQDGKYVASKEATEETEKKSC